MSDVIHCTRIVPVAELDNWKAATVTSSPDPVDTDGLNATVALYDIAEATPRQTITHRAGSGVMNSAQIALLQPLVGGDGYIDPSTLSPACPNVKAKLRNLTQGDPNPYTGMLADANLTPNVN